MKEGIDKIEKKKIANEKRLKAIQEWQKNRNKSFIKVSTKNVGASTHSPKSNNLKHFDYDDAQNSKSNQLKLFDSDEEEEDLSKCFKIRPQFEGKNGHQMLEISSKHNDRFKLDERFSDGEEMLIEEDPDELEKNKNIKILESILGHEVSKKHPIALAKKKIDIERFDPEDENDTSCIKKVENLQKKPLIKNRKAETSINNEEVPITSERYIEVTKNLKDIIGSSSTFSFTEKFNLLEDTKDVIIDKDKESSYTNSIIETHNREINSSLNDATEKIPNSDYEIKTTFKDSFFISDNDERLKEGIEFFMRSKPLDVIREEWNIRRNRVLDIFKRKKKSALKGSRQPKKQNQRKRFPLRK